MSQFVKPTEDSKSYIVFKNPVEVNGVIKFINSEKSKNELGFYELCIQYPVVDENHYAVISSYFIEDNKCKAGFEIKEIEKPPRTFSKLQLEVALFNIGKIEQFDSFLQNTNLSNEYGQVASLKRFYDNANDLKEDNVYFSTYLELGKNYLNIDDETAERILKEAEYKGY